jgi:hypothetical protein
MVSRPLSSAGHDGRLVFTGVILFSLLAWVALILAVIRLI